MLWGYGEQATFTDNFLNIGMLISTGVFDFSFIPFKAMFNKNIYILVYVYP